MTVSLGVNLDPPGEPARTIVHVFLAILTAIFVVTLGWPILRNSLQSRITLESLFLIGICGTFAGSLVCTFTGHGHIYYEVVLVLLAIHRLGRLVSAQQRAQMNDLASLIPGLMGTASDFRS